MLFVRIALMNHVLNVKLVKLIKVKDVQYLGELVTMLIIHIVLINGLRRRKLNVRFVRMYGILLRLLKSELMVDL